MRGLLSKPSVLALESIDFQSGAFFKELTLVFEQIKKVKSSELNDNHELFAVLSGVVKHYTGLNILFLLNDDGPSVSPPKLDKNNVLIENWVRGLIKSNDGLYMIRQAGGSRRGTVSLRNSKVTGIFAEAQARLSLPSKILLGSRFTPEEVAAITLHELGHVFVYYEFMGHTTTTNQVLAGMSKALAGATGGKERETVFVEVKKALGLDNLSISEMAELSDNTAAEIVVVTNLSKKVKSELGSDIYDINSWEYLADEFAARHGAGRHLIVAMDKQYRNDFHKSFRGTAMFMVVEAVKVFLLAPPINILGLAFIAKDMSTQRNDEPGARFKRIRNQLVEELKNKNITASHRERIAADLVAVDEILEKVKDRRQLVGVLYDFIHPKGRLARNQMLLQRELEDLAANNLFVKSAELKHLV